jgi:ABC-type antimicrobial peptide transport system permease subunit
MAVGATFADIMRLVLGRGVRLMLFGLSIGIVITLLLLKRFGIQLGVTDPLDPGSLAGACLTLFAAGLAACLLPALRAGRTDPAQALRQ